MKKMETHGKKETPDGKISGNASLSIKAKKKNARTIYFQKGNPMKNG